MSKKEQNFDSVQVVFPHYALGRMIKICSQIIQISNSISGRPVRVSIFLSVSSTTHICSSNHFTPPAFLSLHILSFTTVEHIISFHPVHRYLLNYLLIKSFTHSLLEWWTPQLEPNPIQLNSP